MTLPQSILIIDDDEAWRQVMARLLVDHFPGARIMGQDAFTDDIGSFDVIGLDLYLRCPAQDTLDSLSARKNHLPPVVCFSGIADSMAAMEASMEAGAHDFISKERAMSEPKIFAEKLTLAYLRNKATHV